MATDPPCQGLKTVISGSDEELNKIKTEAWLEKSSRNLFYVRGSNVFLLTISESHDPYRLQIPQYIFDDISKTEPKERKYDLLNDALKHDDLVKLHDVWYHFPVLRQPVEGSGNNNLDFWFYKAVKDGKINILQFFLLLHSEVGKKFESSCKAALEALYEEEKGKKLSCLLLAIKHQQLEVVEFLLAVGMKARFSSSELPLPLSFALSQTPQNLSIIIKLLSMGASLEDIISAPDTLSWGSFTIKPAELKNYLAILDPNAHTRLVSICEDLPQNSPWHKYVLPETLKTTRLIPQDGQATPSAPTSPTHTALLSQENNSRCSDALNLQMNSGTNPLILLQYLVSQASKPPIDSWEASVEQCSSYSNSPKSSSQARETIWQLPPISSTTALTTLTTLTSPRRRKSHTTKKATITAVSLSPSPPPCISFSVGEFTKLAEFIQSISKAVKTVGRELLVKRLSGYEPQPRVLPPLAVLALTKNPNICLRWNEDQFSTEEQGSCRSGCTLIHICAICLQPHPPFPKHHARGCPALEQLKELMNQWEAKNNTHLQSGMHVLFAIYFAQPKEEQNS